MTEPSTGPTTPSASTPRRRLPRPPSAKPVALSALVLFAAVLVVLALQLHAGRDPALGASATSTARPPRPVLVRRIHRRVIVTTVKVVHDRPSLPAGATAATGDGGVTPVVSVPAPGAPVPAAAPAPAATPAPAPTPAPVATPAPVPPPPAPVQTRSS